MTNTKTHGPWPPGTKVRRINCSWNKTRVGEIYTVVKYYKFLDFYWDDLTILEVPNHKFAARNFKVVLPELNLPKNLSPEYKELFT